MVLSGSEPLVGQNVATYQILRELGRGGMGVVYKAREESLQRVVALKVLPAHLSRQPDFVKRFQREAQAAAQLNHPNIVSIYAVGESDGLQYIAMEYIRGQTLQRCLQEQGHFDVRTALTIARQIAEALAEAHGHGIVHRDVKPLNVMLDEAGRAKVLDFGLAKAHHGISNITVAGARLGTPQYMSPEQVEGGQIDQRSDIFSLGLILVEMLTGRPPFASESPTVVGYKIVHERLPDLAALNPDIPPAVIELADKMTAKSPHRRYPSAECLASELDALLQHEPVARPLKPCRAPTRYGPWAAYGPSRGALAFKRWPWKRYAMAFTAGALLVGACVAGAVLWRLAVAEAVAFPDPNLEAAIRQALDMPEGMLTRADLARLKSLEAVGRGISDLSGLEHCTHLTLVELTNNNLSDITPLERLIMLETVWLSMNQISDITPLEHHPNVHAIALDWNAVADIRPLSTLRQLKQLNLNSNTVATLEPLRDLTHLQTIEISDNPLSDLRTLATFAELRTLNLDDLRSPDLTAIADLRSLERLQVARSNVTDISALSALENVNVLWLHANNIGDIDALRSLHKLSELILSGNQVSDISPIVENPGFGHGAVLYLSGCPEYAGPSPGGNPLSQAAQDEQIPALEARGVKVFY